MLYELLRPLLFRLDPESAHDLTLGALRLLARLGPLNPLRQTLPATPRTVMGLTFPNPVGLAAGLDKNGNCIDGLAALGFGFIELGTVTPRPQQGNPKPRLFRLVDQEALINRFGFNNLGVGHLIERVKTRRASVILGINIGKNRSTPVESALDDYREALSAVYAYADYVTVNISSPNTPGLRTLQRGDALDSLLDGLTNARESLAQTYGKRVPLAVKISPDLESGDLNALAEALVRHGVDAIIATNTTLSRQGVEDSPHGHETGGLSGRPLMAKSTEIVARLHAILRGEIPIIACGGIFSAQDAQAKFAAGASLIQLYSGLIYRGPGLIRAIVESLESMPSRFVTDREHSIP